MGKSEIISEIESRVSNSEKADYVLWTVGITDTPKFEKINMLMKVKMLSIGRIGLQLVKKMDEISKSVF